ncbi:hypothetical protein L4C37_21800 [Vibrio kagoshimensis]|uniref:hypothetical protein n=1 Tax=Vibrio kagoshimensis TaxID=2910244 RepID=UPI003D1B5C7E
MRIFTDEHEVRVAKQYGLYWSRSLHSEYPEIDGLYVYQPSYPIEPFLDISIKLEQLNNHIFLQLCATKQKHELAKEDKRSPHYLENNGNLYSEIVDHNIESWDYNLNVLSLVNPIILISTFLEWSLKRLLHDCCDGVKYKSKKGIANIDGMLALIIKSLSLDIQVPKDFQEALNKYRLVRNKFAHGEWEKISSLYDLEVRDYLLHCSRLLKTLEAEILRKKYTYTGTTA